MVFPPVKRSSSFCGRVARFLDPVHSSIGKRNAEGELDCDLAFLDCWLAGRLENQIQNLSRRSRTGTPPYESMLES
jgi:hypothetical protein